MSQRTRLERISTIVLGNLEELGKHVERWVARLDDGWYLSDVSIDCDVSHVRTYAGKTVNAQVIYTATVTLVQEAA